MAFPAIRLDSKNQPLGLLGPGGICGAVLWLETALFTARAVNPHFPCLRGRLETPVAEPLAESDTSGIPAIRGNAHPTGRRGDHQVRWYMSFLYLHHFLQPAASKTGLKALRHSLRPFSQIPAWAGEPGAPGQRPGSFHA